MSLGVQSGLRTLEGLQKQKSVHAVAATDTFFSNWSLVQCNNWIFMFFHQKSYSRPKTLSFRFHFAAQNWCSHCCESISQKICLCWCSHSMLFLLLQHPKRNTHVRKKCLWFPINIDGFFCLQHLPSGKANSPTLNGATQAKMMLWCRLLFAGPFEGIGKSMKILIVC